MVELPAGLDLVRQLHGLALLHIGPSHWQAGPKPHRLAAWLLSFLLLRHYLLRLHHLLLLHYLARLLLLLPLLHCRQELLLVHHLLLYHLFRPWLLPWLKLLLHWRPKLLPWRLDLL